MTSPQASQLYDDPQIVELAGQQFVAKFFQYLVPSFSFSGSATILQTLQIDSDADFQLLMTMGDYTSSNATVQVTEGGAGGLAWSSDVVPIDCFMGNAQNPFPIGLIPQLLPKKRVYQFSVVNSSGGANTIQIVLSGYKLYPLAMAAQVGAQPSS